MSVPITDFQAPFHTRVRNKVNRLKKSTTFHVAVTAAAGAGAAYFGTRQALQTHAIDVYFKIANQIDEITPALEVKD